MNGQSMFPFDALTPWQTRTPGPVLRGRRLDANGTVLHFLSGNGFCGGVYWPMLRRFLPDYDLFLHDIEGQGASAAPARFSGVNAVLDRLYAVMQEQGLVGRPLIGMGHSFGSQLTVLLAARHPGLFKALVLTDPILFPPLIWLGVRSASALGRHPLGAGTRRRRDAWPARNEVLAHLRGRGIYKGWTEEALECFVDHATREQGGQRVLCCPKEIEAQIFEQPAWPWNAWRKLELPVLFIRGAQSYPFFPAAERWARMVKPGTVFMQLTGGHCFMQENPPAAAAAIKEFLSTLSTLPLSPTPLPLGERG